MTSVIASLVILGVVAALNRNPRPGARQNIAVAVAVIVMAALGVWLRMYWTGELNIRAGARGGWYYTSASTEFVKAYVRYLVIGGLFAASMTMFRRERLRNEALHETEIAQAQLGQQLDEARLQALLAQIEPHFLFNTLANVRGLYQSDSGSAKRMLGNLRRYLTVALPRMRESESTVGREAALAEAYLGIQQIRMGKRLAFSINVPAELRHASLPPMMLLTLVENAIKHGLGRVARRRHDFDHGIAGRRRIVVAGGGHRTWLRKAPGQRRRSREHSRAARRIAWRARPTAPRPQYAAWRDGDDHRCRCRRARLADERLLQPWPFAAGGQQRRVVRFAVQEALRAHHLAARRLDGVSRPAGDHRHVDRVARDRRVSLRVLARSRQLFAQELAIFELVSFVYLACVLAADQAVSHGAARVRTYVLAVLVASLLAALIDTAIRMAFTDFFEKAQPWWRPVHTASHFIWGLVLGGFSIFVYADLKRNRETAARLQAATLQRTRSARAVLQTQLQAMQARVEPQFLFDTLDRIGEIYDRDPTKGQQTIDDLIAYLRTAMPQMHEASSTLARELDLVRTYVAIVAACSEGRVRLAIEGKEDWAHTAFPPMLLLPLVEHAISSGRLTRPGDGAISLRALRTDGKLHVTVGHGGSAFSADAGSDAVGRVREHLQTLFDSEARVDLHTRVDRGTEVAMEIPL